VKIGEKFKIFVSKIVPENPMRNNLEGNASAF
jgi:hypothetical protein